MSPKIKHFLQQAYRTVFVMAVIGLVISLFGCASEPQPRVVVKEVKVEVPVRCKADLPEDPKRPFDDTATQDMSLFDKTKLLLAQKEYAKAYEAVLKAAVKSCVEERAQ